MNEQRAEWIARIGGKWMEVDAKNAERERPNKRRHRKNALAHDEEEENC